MPTLPEGQSLLIRTYFGDDGAWAQVARDAQASHVQDSGYEAQAFLTTVDDPEFADMSVSRIVGLVESPPPDYLFVVDQRACDEPEHPVLVVDTSADPDDEAATFRVVPSRLAVIENNLSIANLSFDDLRSGADLDGVYRGAGAVQTIEKPQVRSEDLIAAADNADDSPTVQQLREDLRKRSVPVWPAMVVTDLRDRYDAIAGGTYNSELTIGYDETLQVLARGGSGLGVHFALVDSYWSIYLDSDSLSLLAAMKVIYPS